MRLREVRSLRRSDVLIRDEAFNDISKISQLITEAFETSAHATGAEARIVEGLRAKGALDLSLVMQDEGEIVGYLAASTARIGAQAGWGLIGPLAVAPSRHRGGIGTALMEEALRRLRTTHPGAALVGDPGYYGRFGFRSFPGLGLAGLPCEFVLAHPFTAAAPVGELIIHPAFGLDQEV